MELIALGRGRGKTQRVVEWLRDNPEGVVMVTNRHERHRLVDQYELTDEEAARVKVFDRAIIRTLAKQYPRPKLAIDNIDMVLSGMFGGAGLELATITAEVDYGEEDLDDD